MSIAEFLATAQRNAVKGKRPWLVGGPLHRKELPEEYFATRVIALYDSPALGRVVLAYGPFDPPPYELDDGLLVGYYRKAGKGRTYNFYYTFIQAQSSKAAHATRSHLQRVK